VSGSVSDLYADNGEVAGVSLRGLPAQCTGRITRLDSQGAAGTVTCTNVENDYGSKYAFTVSFTASF
jgi:hypothetical protein